MSICDLETIRAFNPPYAKLHDLGKSGDLRIIWLFSLPRSHSTAVEIALCESPSIHGQYHEPFYLEGPTYEAMNDILSRYENLRKKSNGTPVTLLIKDTLSKQMMPPERLHYFFHLCEDFIILLRDPIEIMQSMKDAHFVDDFIEDAIKFWGPFQETVRLLQTHLYETGKTGLLIDAEEFRISPLHTFETICDHLGIEYTEKMVTNWTFANKGNFVSAYDDILAEKAINADRFLVSRRKTCSLENWPREINYALRTIAYKAYNALQSSGPILSQNHMEQQNFPAYAPQ